MKKTKALLLCILSFSTLFCSECLLSEYCADLEELRSTADIKLGAIKGRSVLFVNENDEPIGNYYHLDNGGILLDPSGGGVTCMQIDGQDVRLGGLWDFDETLYTTEWFDWGTPCSLKVYNQDRDDVKTMVVVGNTSCGRGCLSVQRHALENGQTH